MRKLLLLFWAALPLVSFSQTGTFEGQPLPTADTYYVNYTMPGKDVGFDEGYIHYPCVYDTSSFGNYWASGFAYSNKKDSVTSGFENQYAAKPARGHNGSDKYVVAYGQTNIFALKPKGWAWFNDLYITNSTYAYNSMRNGDGFAKKFGGVSGNDSDWFKLTIRGNRSNDSIIFFLADFRFAAKAQDYIVSDWRRIDLRKLNVSDTLLFELSSSDTGAFGINTPLYFCLDDVSIMHEGVATVSFSDVATISPNPATNFLHLDVKSDAIKEATILDVTGRTVANFSVTRHRIDINTNSLPTGQYILKLTGDDGVAVTRFIKQ